MKRFASLLFAVLAASAAQATTFKVIVHPDLNVASLPVSAVSDVFMKKIDRWTNGVTIVPVDQSSGAVRDDFSRVIHGKTANSIRQYWTQQIYSGHAVPPVQKRSDAEVVDYVKATPGAIGYVSETAPTDGVRVITVSGAP